MAVNPRVQQEAVRIDPTTNEVIEWAKAVRLEGSSIRGHIESNKDLSEKPDSLRLLSVLWRARAELSLADVEILATELESEIQALPEDDISAIYAAVRCLLAEDPPTASSESERRRLLERLRTLQKAEAEEMTRYFEDHRALKPGTGLKALDTAKELLSKHESVATKQGGPPSRS